MTSTAPQLLHSAHGHPSPKWPLEPHAGRCLTCGAPITEGVNFEQHINISTFSNHTTLTRYGTHACQACAWLYSDAKSKHRAFLVIGATAIYPVINTASVTPDRPQWLDALRSLQQAPPDTPTAALLTTDPKPRLWDNVRITTPRDPTIYLHNPDQNISANVRINVEDTIRLTHTIAHAQALGFSKTSALTTLTREHQRYLKHLPTSHHLESLLKPARGTRELQVAATIAQKEHHLDA